MGLSCHWKLPENTFLEFEPGLESIPVREKRFPTYFRGNLYSTFFLNEVGHSLHQDMDNELVRTVADALLAMDWEDRFATEYRLPERERELVDLRRMFQGYGNVGARMTASF